MAYETLPDAGIIISPCLRLQRATCLLFLFLSVFLVTDRMILEQKLLDGLGDLLEPVLLSLLSLVHQMILIVF